MGDTIRISTKRWTNKDSRSNDFFKAIEESSSLDVPIESILVEGVSNTPSHKLDLKENRGGKNH